jgi:hypothetical protein
VPGPWVNCTVPASFTPIKYLSSDHIMTWSIRTLCCASHSLTAAFRYAIWLIFVVSLWNQGTFFVQLAGFW